MKQKDLTIAFLVLVICVFATLVTPYILTQYSFLDLTQTGPIGDTIGGITSPITNLLGAVLVFYAFKAQIESNELTRNQFTQQVKDELKRKKLFYITEQINVIREDINEFSFTHSTIKTTGGKPEPQIDVPHKGASAFYAYISLLPALINSCERDGIDPFKALPKLAELEKLLEMLDSLFNLITATDILEQDKKYFLHLLSYQYLSKIKPAFTAQLQEYRKIPVHLTLERPFGKSESVFTDRIHILIQSIDSKII